MSGKNAMAPTAASIRRQVTPAGLGTSGGSSGSALGGSGSSAAVLIGASGSTSIRSTTAPGASAFGSGPGRRTVAVSNAEPRPQRRTPGGEDDDEISVRYAIRSRLAHSILLVMAKC